LSQQDFFYLPVLDTEIGCIQEPVWFLILQDVEDLPDCTTNGSSPYLVFALANSVFGVTQDIRVAIFQMIDALQHYAYAESRVSSRFVEPADMDCLVRCIDPGCGPQVTGQMLRRREPAYGDDVSHDTGRAEDANPA
jgi:hypothetical protein